MQPMLARVAAVASASAERTAFVDGCRRVSYGAFWAQVLSFAARLHALGLQPGDRVAIVLPNRVEAAVACYGTWLAGCVAVPLNVQARARDLAPWLQHCHARVVVHERGHADAAQAVAASSHAPQAIVLDEAQAFADTPLQQQPPVLASADDSLALLLYTSGTTGRPKGVMLSHANVAANAEAVIGYLQLRATDSVLSVLPFYYAYGASVLHTHLACGACVLLAQNLVFPHLIVAAMAAERVTGFSGVPSTFALLLDRDALAGHDLPHLRYLTQAGGAMPPALTRRLRAALPAPRLYVMYGQTEATSRLTWLPPERLDDKPGSVGIPVAGVEVRITTPEGDALPAGHAGGVRVRGPNVMLGYWEDRAATDAVLRDGWLDTGDVGHLDVDGFLYLLGRRSDMIKTGAHRVFPGDVEEAISEVPGVTDAAVVGVDDEVMGQVIKAYVVAAIGQTLDANRIRAHCRARLAPYKVPKHVEFVTALPRTASGKVRRIQLMESKATT